MKSKEFYIVLSNSVWFLRDHALPSKMPSHGMSEDGWWKATPNHVASRMQSVSVELFFLLCLFPGIFSVLALVLKRRLHMKKM